MKKSRWIFLIILMVLLCFSVVALSSCDKNDAPIEENPIDETKKPDDDTEDKKQEAIDTEVDAPEDEVVAYWHIDKNDDFPENFDELTAEEQAVEAEKHIMAYITKGNYNTVTLTQYYELTLTGAGEMVDFTMTKLDDGFVGAPWFSTASYCSYIEKININKDITNIGDYAFYYCNKVEEIQISSAISRIGKYAFANCWALETINTPDNILEIDEGAFQSCLAITSFVLPTSITTIQERTFECCIAMQSIKFSPNIEAINGKAFRQCISLSLLTVPSTVTTIGDFAFEGSKCVLYIQNLRNAFREYTSWASDCSVYFLGLNGSPSILSGYFEYVPNETGYTITNFRKDGKGEVIIPDKINEVPITQIGNYAFKNNINVTKVTFASNCAIPEIGFRTFYACTGLQTVVLPVGVTKIGVEAFYDCTSLVNLNLNELTNLTEIGEYAFTNCISLSSIYLQNSLTKLGQDSFKNCKSATSLVIGSSLGSISSNAFYECNSIETVTFNSNNGVSALTNIGAQAFLGCRSLKEISLPETVIGIENNVFKDCISLENIYIGQSVSSSFENWFNNCTELKNINVSSTNALYSSNDGIMLNKNQNIMYCFPGGRVGISYTVPTTIQEVKSTAFASTSIVIYGTHQFAGSDTLNVNNAFYYIGEKPIYKVENQFEYIIKYIIKNEITGEETISYSYGDPNNSEVIITYGIPASTEVIIPQYLGNNKLVSEIGKYAFLANTVVQKVTTSDSLREIDSYAFFNCTSLKTIYIGNSVSKVSAYAFQNAVSLEKIYLGTGVEAVEIGAFYKCKNLNTVYIGNENLMLQLQKKSSCGYVINYAIYVYIIGTANIENDESSLTAKCYLTTEKYTYDKENRVLVNDQTLNFNGQYWLFTVAGY